MKALVDWLREDLLPATQGFERLNPLTGTTEIYIPRGHWEIRGGKLVPVEKPR